MVTVPTEVCRLAAITSSIGATADRSRELTVLTACSARRCPRDRSVAATRASVTSRPQQSAAGAGQRGEVVLPLESALVGPESQDRLERGGVHLAAGADAVQRVEQRRVHLLGDLGVGVGQG